MTMNIIADNVMLEKKMDVHSREQSIAAMTPHDRLWCVVMEVKMVGQLNSATKFWSNLAVSDLLHSANGIKTLLPKRRTTIGSRFVQLYLIVKIIQERCFMA
jgi:hypothetical protein